MTIRDPRAQPAAPVPQWMKYPAIAVFLLYAANFLYFFVDDEGIPFVYAQQVLNRHGLVYTSVADGRVEGYSDFLHIWADLAILWLTRALHWPKISVFFVGRGLALAAGVATILLVFSMLRRLRVSLPGATAGLAFLALAGPFAVWSCSSLETMPFAALCTLLTWALVRNFTTPTTWRSDALVAVISALIMLERIDGFIFAGGLVVAFVAASPPRRRVEMFWRTLLPMLAVFIAYNGWRIWYFGSVMPTPLAAKVLFKLHPNPYLLTKMPDRSYASSFIDLYGWVAAGAALAAMTYAALRERVARPLLLALGALASYVAAVGDWMFGFRFFVSLLPLMAVLLALGVSAIAGHRRRLGWAAMAAVVLWCGLRAEAFERHYEQTQNDGWLRQPSFEVHRFFKGYADVLAVAEEHVPPFSSIAYNQAGLIPFMLDLHNTDNLGVTSKFYAELPSTDLFFTEVGRYAPLTEKRSIRATDAYLLYRDIPFVFAGQNSGLAPDELMGGFYRKIRTIRGEGLYVRTDRSTSAYRSDPTLFLENLAHLSSLRRIVVNGRSVPDADRLATLPFFADGYDWAEMVSGAFVLEAEFAATDQPVYAFDVNGVVSENPVQVTLELFSTSGATRTVSFDTTGGATAESSYQRLDNCSASRLRLTIRGRDAAVWLHDIRVQGQSPALAEYIRKRLFFPR